MISTNECTKKHQVKVTFSITGCLYPVTETIVGIPYNEVDTLTEYLNKRLLNLNIKIDGVLPQVKDIIAIDTI